MHGQQNINFFSKNLKWIEDVLLQTVENFLQF